MAIANSNVKTVWSTEQTVIFNLFTEYLKANSEDFIIKNKYANYWKTVLTLLQKDGLFKSFDITYPVFDFNNINQENVFIVKINGFNPSYANSFSSLWKDWVIMAMQHVNKLQIAERVEKTKERNRYKKNDIKRVELEVRKDPSTEDIKPSDINCEKISYEDSVASDFPEGMIDNTYDLNNRYDV